MARYKLAGKAKKSTGRPTAAVPCVIVILGVFALIMLLFYFVLKSGG